MILRTYLKSLKTNNDSYIKKYLNLIKKKSFLIVTENSIGESGLTVGSVLYSMGFGSRFGILLVAGSSFVASIVGLITKEYCSKLKMMYTNQRDWIKLTKVFYEKILRESRIDQKIVEQEELEFKKI